MKASRVGKILEAIPDMILLMDGSGVLLDFKPSRNFDPIVPPDSFLGKHLAEVLPGELATRGMVKVGKVLKTGREELLEYSLMVEGVARYYEARFTTFDEDQVLVVVRDISDEKSSAIAARALINASDDLFLLLDSQGCILSINEAAAKSYGKPPETMEGTQYWDHLPPEIAHVGRERFGRILGSGDPGRYIDFWGDMVFEVFGNPVKRTDGTVQWVAYFIRNITDQVKAEQDVIESDARHRRLFDENPVPMYIYDTKTLMILHVNRSFLDNYGYTRQEITSMSIGDIRPREDVEKVLENVADLKSRQVYLGLWRHTKKDGTIVDVEITSGDFPFLDSPARLVICHDVTEKLRFQRVLEDREEQYRHLFEQNPLPMMILDPGTLKFLNVNNAALEHYGYEKEEFLSLSARDIRPPG